MYEFNIMKNFGNAKSICKNAREPIASKITREKDNMSEKKTKQYAEGIINM